MNFNKPCPVKVKGIMLLAVLDVCWELESGRNNKIFQKYQRVSEQNWYALTALQDLLQEVAIICSAAHQLYEKMGMAIARAWYRDQQHKQTMPSGIDFLHYLSGLQGYSSLLSGAQSGIFVLETWHEAQGFCIMYSSTPLDKSVEWGFLTECLQLNATLQDIKVRQVNNKGQFLVTFSSTNALKNTQQENAMPSLLCAAHELKNPLSIVLGRAVLLEEEEHKPAQHAGKEIRQAVQRCKDILDLYAGQAQQHSTKAVDLNEIILFALKQVKNSLLRADIDIQLNLSTDTLSTKGDFTVLSQVMVNLLSNAREALLKTSQPRILQITSKLNASAKTIHIEITDTGPGIAKQHRDKVFQPYFSSKTSTTISGIGLTLAQTSILAHQGSVNYQPAKSGGASFIISLPLYVAQVVPLRTK